jgi:hypothetical protein
LEDLIKKYQSFQICESNASSQISSIQIRKSSLFIPNIINYNKNKMALRIFSKIHHFLLDFIE